MKHLIRTDYQLPILCTMYQIDLILPAYIPWFAAIRISLQLQDMKNQKKCAIATTYQQSSIILSSILTQIALASGMQVFATVDREVFLRHIRELRSFPMT